MPEWLNCLVGWKTNLADFCTTTKKQRRSKMAGAPLISTFTFQRVEDDRSPIHSPPPQHPEGDRSSSHGQVVSERSAPRRGVKKRRGKQNDGGGNKNCQNNNNWCPTGVEQVIPMWEYYRCFFSQPSPTVSTVHCQKHMTGWGKLAQFAQSIDRMGKVSTKREQNVEPLTRSGIRKWSFSWGEHHDLIWRLTVLPR